MVSFKKKVNDMVTFYILNAGDRRVSNHVYNENGIIINWTEKFVVFFRLMCALNAYDLMELNNFFSI